MKNKITFFVPVLNEEKQIERCLKSIRDQNYDQNNVEIFLADAGCSDNTVEIAKRFKVTYFFNKRKLSEYAYKEAIAKCKGDYFVFFAADNELPNKNWINFMIEPFQYNENIEAVYTHISVPKKSSLINKYYSFLHVEPLTWFIYKDEANPKYFINKYFVYEERENYKIFEFDKKNFPLIATAQGLVVKKTFNYIKGDFGDDILPLINLIEDGKFMAYSEKSGIYHHHIDGFKGFFLKYSERTSRSLNEKNHGFKERTNLLNIKRKIKLMLYLPYVFSIIFPIIDTVFLFLRHKHRSILLHLPANLFLSFAILKEIIKKILNVKR